MGFHSSFLTCTRLFVQELCNPEHPNFLKAFDAVSAMVQKKTDGTTIQQAPDFKANFPGLFQNFSLAKPPEGTPGKPTSWESGAVWMSKAR